jgi:L-threonylcarbamoyladenylate synthase
MKLNLSHVQIITSNNLDLAVELLKNGKTLVFPTETSYGLGCDATNQTAVDNIFKIKSRPDRRPLLVVVPTVEMAREYLVWDDLLEDLSAKYWPGPLTIVGKAKGGLAQGVISPDNTVAVRVSAHPVVKYLSENLGRPLVATSANISGAGDLYSAKEIEKIFEQNKIAPDAIIDAGDLSQTKPTTIISVGDGKIKILRQGELIIS